MTTASRAAPDASRYCTAVPGAGGSPPPRTAVTDGPCATAGIAELRSTVIVAAAAAPTANSAHSATSAVSIHPG